MKPSFECFCVSVHHTLIQIQILFRKKLLLMLYVRLDFQTMLSLFLAALVLTIRILIIYLFIFSGDLFLFLIRKALCMVQRLTLYGGYESCSISTIYGQVGNNCFVGIPVKAILRHILNTVRVWWPLLPCWILGLDRLHGL